MGDMADYFVGLALDHNGSFFDPDEEAGSFQPAPVGGPFASHRPTARGIGNCPRCGAATVLRRNNSSGKQFYGCSKFPRCKGSRSFE